MELGDLNREYWNMDIEPKLNTAEIKELQLEKLKAALQVAIRQHAVQQKTF